MTHRTKTSPPPQCLSASVPQCLSRPPRPPRAFTLMELLVVIGLIALLASILVPVVFKAKRQANAAKIAADLQTVSLALEAYRAEFGDYPRLPPIAPSPNGRNIVGTGLNYDTGSVLLAWALVAPYPAKAPTGAANYAAVEFDGADSLGFRIRPGGQGPIHLPYITPDRLQIVQESNGYVLKDSFGNTIYYYAAKPGIRSNIADATPTTIVEVPGTPPKYFTLGDFNLVGPDASETVSGALPPLFNPLDNSGPSGYTLRRAVKTANFTGPFLLWSAGADNLLNTKDDVSSLSK